MEVSDGSFFCVVKIESGEDNHGISLPGMKMRILFRVFGGVHGLGSVVAPGIGWMKVRGGEKG